MISFDAIHARTRHEAAARADRATPDDGQPPFAELFSAERRAADRSTERSDRSDQASRFEQSGRTEASEPIDRADNDDRVEPRHDGQNAEPGGGDEVGAEHEHLRPLYDGSMTADPATSSSPTSPVVPLVPLGPIVTLGRVEVGATTTLETPHGDGVSDAASPVGALSAASGGDTALTRHPGAAVAASALAAESPPVAPGLGTSPAGSPPDVDGAGRVAAGTNPSMISAGVEAPAAAPVGEPPVHPRPEQVIGATELSVAAADERAHAAPNPPGTDAAAISADQELPTEAALTAAFARAGDGPNPQEMRATRSAPSHGDPVADTVDQSVLADAATPVEAAPLPDVSAELASVEPGAGSRVAPVVDETVLIDEIAQPEPTPANSIRGAEAVNPSSAKSPVYRAAEIIAIKEMFEQVDRQRLAATGSIEVEIQTDRFGPIRVEALDAGEGVQLQLRSNGEGGDDLRDLARQLQQEFDRDDDAGRPVVVADSGDSPVVQMQPAAGSRDSGVDVQL